MHLEKLHCRKSLEVTEADRGWSTPAQPHNKSPALLPGSHHFLSQLIHNSLHTTQNVNTFSILWTWGPWRDYWNKFLLGFATGKTFYLIHTHTHTYSHNPNYLIQHALLFPLLLRKLRAQFPTQVQSSAQPNFLIKLGVHSVPCLVLSLFTWSSIICMNLHPLCPGFFFIFFCLARITITTWHIIYSYSSLWSVL